MVAKVELLLEKYRVKNPLDAMTEEEFADLDEQKQEEIRDLAASNSFRKRVAYYKKDENGKYALDENGRRIPVTFGEIFDKDSSGDKALNAATIYYKRKIAIKFQAYIEQHDYMETKPELAEWAPYSYEEILQMEADGVMIPEEVLEWAHSMQDSEATDYLFDEEIMELLGENSGDAELLQLQKKTLALGNQAEKAEDEAKVKQAEFQETSEKAASIKREQESSIKDSLKEIDKLTQEWDTLSKKVKDGKKLSAAEKNRYKELAGLLNGEDGKLTTQIQTSNDDLDNLMKMMDGLEVDITENIELGDDTVEAAKELAKYEKTHKVITTETTMNPAIDTVSTSITDARGQNISVEAQSKGNSLIEFSNNLDNTLMNAQYAALYEFAQTYTEDAGEVLEKTQEAMGSDFHKSKEDLEKEIDALPSMNKAEEEQAAMRENGGRFSLLKEAAYFGAQSVELAALSTGAIVETQIAQAVSIVQLAKGSVITKQVEAAVEHINERREYLEKRQEEAEKARQEQEQKIRRHVDELAEKAKDGDEDAKTELKEMAENKDAIAAMVEAVCQMIFSENDKAELETLDDTVLEIGQRSQEKLDKAFKTNEKATEKLPEFKETAQDSIDYGVISAQDGAQLLSQYNLLLAISPLFAMAAMSLLVIGMFASISGVAAMAAGGVEKLEAKGAEAIAQHTEQALLNDETQVETQTEVAGLSSVAADEEAEEEVETGEAETTEQVEESNDDAEEETGVDGNTDVEAQEEVQNNAGEVVENVATITVGDEMPQQTATETSEEGGVAEGVENSSKESNEPSLAEYIQNKADEIEKEEQKAKDAEKDQKDAEEVNKDGMISQAKSGISESKEMGQETKKDNAETVKKTKEAEKDEKTLKKQQKNVEKENEKLAKKIEKLNKDSEEAAAEKELLNAEYLTLSEQNTQMNQQVMAAQAKQQQQAANPNQQGGLLSSPAGNMSNMQQNIATITVNQNRMNEISARSTELDARVTKNTQNAFKTRSKIVKNSQKLKKIAKEKLKIQKEQQKAEKEKQRKLQVRNAVMNVFKNLFSIVGSIGSILSIVGKVMFASGQAMLSNPFTAAVGAALMTSGAALMGYGETMTYVGLAGNLLCAVVQGAIAMAEGDLAGGLMQIGMAVVQAAITVATMGAGGGAAAAADAAAQATAQVGAQAVAQATAQASAQMASMTVAQGFQVASAAVSITTSTMDMANDFIVIGGSERNQGLAMATQIMGMANSLMGLGAGMADGGYKQVSQWMMMAGTLLSTASQIGTMGAKEGDDTTWAQIVGMIGSGLQIAGAVASLGESISAKTASSKSTGKNVSKTKAAAQKADAQVAESEKAVQQIDTQIANAKDNSQKESLMKQKQQAQKQLIKDKQSAKKAHDNANKAEKAHQEALAREKHKAEVKAEKQAAKANRTNGNSNSGNTQNTNKPAEQPKPADTPTSSDTTDPANNTDNQQTTDNAVAASKETAEQKMQNEAKAKSVKELKNEIKGLKKDISKLEADFSNIDDPKIAALSSEMKAEIQSLGENATQEQVDAIKAKFGDKLNEIEAYQTRETKKAELQINTAVKNQKIDSGMKTAEQVVKIVTQAAQVGSQIAGASAADNSTHEQQAKANLDLSSMEKTRALVKKIKRKNKAMAGGHR